MNRRDFKSLLVVAAGVGGLAFLALVALLVALTYWLSH